MSFFKLLKAHRPFKSSTKEEKRSSWSPFSTRKLFRRSPVQAALSLVPLTDATLAQRAPDLWQARRPEEARPLSCIGPGWIAPIDHEDAEVETWIEVGNEQATSIEEGPTEGIIILTNESGTVKYRPSSADMSVVRRGRSKSRTAIIESWRVGLESKQKPDADEEARAASGASIDSAVALCDHTQAPADKTASVTTTMLEDWKTPSAKAAEKKAATGVSCPELQNRELPVETDTALPLLHGPPIRNMNSNSKLRAITPWQGTGVAPNHRHPSVQFKHGKQLDPDRYTRKFVKVEPVPLSAHEVNVFLELKRQKMRMRDQNASLEEGGPLTKRDVLAALQAGTGSPPGSTGMHASVSSRTSRIIRGHAGLRLLKLSPKRCGEASLDGLWDVDPFTREVFVVEPAWQIGTDAKMQETGRLPPTGSVKQSWVAKRHTTDTEKRHHQFVGDHANRLYESVSTIRLVKA
jgi:hypothetical protein